MTDEKKPSHGDIKLSENVMSQDHLMFDGEKWVPFRLGPVRLKPGDTWEYVGCRTCGNVITVSKYRIEAEGMPWCSHSRSTTYGPPEAIYPTYTRMIYVDVMVR